MVNIAEEIARGNINAEIVTVISSRSAVAGVERVNELGLEPHVVRKKDYPDIGAFSDKIVSILDEAEVDLVLQCGWLCFWELPSRYDKKVMNIHPALLPLFGGKGMWGHHVHEAVLAAGCKVSGCTVHFVTNEYDAGPIILQRCCEVLPGDDGASLAARVFELECLAYPEAIKMYAEGSCL